MKPVHLRYLLLAAFVGFAAIRCGVHLCKTSEGMFEVEFAGAIILGFVLATGLFFSLKAGFFDRSWRTIFTGIGFLLIYGFSIIGLQISAMQTLQILVSIPPLHDTGGTMELADVYEKTSQHGVETTPQVAQFFYREMGLKLPVRGADGKIAVFQPSDQDKAAFEITKEADAAVARFALRMASNVQRLHWLSLLYAGSFLLAFLAGLLSIGIRAPMQKVEKT